MLERDPFGKEGLTRVADDPNRDAYSVEGERADRTNPVFGMEASHANDSLKDMTFRQKKTRAWVMGGIIAFGAILIVLAGLGITWYRANLFKTERVLLLFEGPNVISGDNTEHFFLTYENQNGVDLENAVILFRFPDNFVPEERSGLKRDGTTSARLEVGSIAAKQRKVLDVYGSFSGTTQSAVYLRAIVQYSVKNSSGLFQQETQKSMAVETSLVNVDMTLPIESATGDLVEIAVQYTNRGKEAIFSERLQMSFPDGFTLQGSDAIPSEGNNVWYLEPLEPGAVKTFKLYGRILGDRGNFKAFVATIGMARGDKSFVVHGKSEKKLQLVGSPFDIKITENNGNTRTVFPGDELEFTVDYTNRGDLGLRDAIVRVVLDGRVLDETAIMLAKGSYDASKKTITWKASDIPELAFMDPKESGTIKFIVPVRRTIPLSTANDTRFVESIVASIDSADVPDRIGTRRVVAQDFRELNLGTTPSIVADIRENLTNLNLPDVGFEVGKETELVIYVRLRNTYNDVSGGKYTLTIPSGVTFAGMVSLEGNETTSYDSRAQQLVWDVGKLKFSTGVLLPDRVIAFRVKIIPQEYQLHSSAVVLNVGEFRGTDDFTKEPVVATQDVFHTKTVLAKGEVVR